MDFNNLCRTWLSLSLAFCCAVLAACSGGTAADEDNEYGIGVKPTTVSSLSVPEGDQPVNVVIFDKTVRRIHQFELQSMRHVRTLEVRNPDLDHYVLYGQNGNYIVDLSLKGLTIFNKYNQANHQPIRFFGKPKTAAFDPARGLLIVYDDLMTVGILKLDGNGEVLKSWVGGAIVSGDKTIASGDINSSGQLILALSDNSIVMVDVDQTLALKKWQFSEFPTTLKDVRWLAPLPLTPHQALVRTATQLALIDVQAKAVLSTYNIEETVVKLSKLNDPHVLMRVGSMLKIAYVDAGAIATKTLYVSKGPMVVDSVLSSNLNLSQDSWSFVETKTRAYSIFNDLDEARTSRRFRRYQFSSLVATHEKNIADEAQIELASSFIFNLFPSELGYAVRDNLNFDEKIEAKLFNLHYIPAN